VREEQKRQLLVDFLATHPDPPVIIFVNLKSAVDVLAKGLEKLGCGGFWLVVSVFPTKPWRPGTAPCRCTAAAARSSARRRSRGSRPAPRTSSSRRTWLAAALTSPTLPTSSTLTVRRRGVLCEFFSCVLALTQPPIATHAVPRSIEDYTHRIGRTGRAGKSGTAITYLTEADRDVFFDLREMMARSANSVMPPEFSEHPAAKVKPGTAMTKRGKVETV
jgi:superfamily II DNA/RNA helicase